MKITQDMILRCLFDAARSFYFHQQTGEYWNENETKETIREHLFLALASAAEYLCIAPHRKPRIDYHAGTGIVTLSFVLGKWESNGVVHFDLLGREGATHNPS